MIRQEKNTHFDADSLLRLSALGLSALGFYESRISTLQSERKALKTQSDWIAVARFLVFTILIVFLVIAIRQLHPAGMLIPLFLVAGFLWLVQRSAAINLEIQHLDHLIRINEDEIGSLKGDYHAFDPGGDFVDYHHPFSYDLDIFGVSSLFRMINRTETARGRETLASYLANPITDPDRIRELQKAVKELAGKPLWRQDFLAFAKASNWKEERNRTVQEWIRSGDLFSKTGLYRALIWVNLMIAVILPALVMIPLIPAYFLAYYLLPLVIVLYKTRMINREQQKAEQLLGMFRKYMGMVEMVEKEPFVSGYLDTRKAGLALHGVAASRILKELTGILWGLELRGNLLMAAILNAFLLWDILVMLRLEKWRRSFRDAFRIWAEIIADFESMISLANLAYNHPEYTFPEVLDGPFRMVMEEAGHPLIDPARRVDNSLAFPGSGHLYLITGANMSGKSTLLRMTGVNMVLAMAGAPVCARSMSLAPAPLQTSVRTNDSLTDDESYFYAELKKLNRIIAHLEDGNPLFVIIDEMLKGTNSKDKHAGSAALIGRLIKLNASGLVATHDVELGNLASQYPGRLINRCFEVTSEGDQLSYDYRLREGVSSSLNATFLMRRMGIIGED